MSSAEERSVLRTVVVWLYGGVIVALWGMVFYYGGLDNAVKILEPYFWQIWSPTGDPVLNFLIDAPIVIAIVLFSIGFIALGVWFFLRVVPVLLGLIFLMWLGSLSPVGAVVAVLTFVGGVVFLVRWGMRRLARRRRSSFGRTAARAAYGSAEEAGGRDRVGSSRVTRERGAWSQRMSGLFGNYVERYKEDGSRAGYSETGSGVTGPYEQHYGPGGEKQGYSRKETDSLGRKRTQDYTQSGEKSGYSRKETGAFGGEYDQHYKPSGEKDGYSRKETDLLGQQYTQEYNQDGTKRKE